MSLFNYLLYIILILISIKIINNIIILICKCKYEIYIRNKCVKSPPVP